jgi:hypothetical protein
MIYRTICTQLWTDPKVRRLTVQGKLFFVYAITNPHTHLCGVYYLPTEVVVKETGLKDTLCHTLYDTLSKVGLCYRDEETETIFVTNMFRYQGKGEKNEKAAANHLITLHHSSLIHRFFAIYPVVLTYWTGYPIDTLSDTPSESGKRCPSVPDPVLLTSSLDSERNLKSKMYSRKTNGVCAIPDEWTPNESHQKLASARKLELALEAAHFRNKAKELEWVQKDWDLKFTNWMLQEVKFRQRRTP